MATDETVRSQWASEWQVRLYDWLEEYEPVVLDWIRDYFWRRQERDRDRYHKRRDYRREIAELRRVMPQDLPIPRVAGPVRPGAERAVLVGMHWLQAGGAERWAVETVRLVREAGLLPILITDRDSHQPWIARADLDGALVLCLTHPMAGFPGDDPLLRALVECFDVRGVIVHHCQWLYDRLPWLKLSRPQLDVVDSLHILEFGGGFPRTSAVASDTITTHHVISGQLANWLSRMQRVPPRKVVVAPLSGLTIAESELASAREMHDGPLTLAFVGRKTRQKRPEAFLLLLKRAREAGLDLRAIMHGDGEMEGLVSRMVRRYGLDGVVTLRSSDVPVGRTLAESDVLVVTSSNEGITLTSFEAIAAGVPVISTDVGAQSEIIPTEGLLPRLTSRMVPAALAELQRLREPAARDHLLELERDAVARLGARPSASEWMKGVVESWAR